MIRQTLTVPPSGEPLSLDEVKAHLRIGPDTPDDDALIVQYLTAARLMLDGKDGTLGRALMTQTWQLGLDAFPVAARPILVPLSPLIDVVSITYLDSEGAAQTLPAEQYRAIAGDYGYLVPAYQQSWPATLPVTQAVTVEVRCGYGSQGADVPQPIRNAILLQVGDLYEHRETIVTGTIVTPVPAAEALVAPYKTSLVA